MRQKLGGVALHVLELIELQIRIGDGKKIAACRMFVNEDPAVLAADLLFDFEDSFAFEHHGQDEADRAVLGVVRFDQLAQERFGGFLLNGVLRRGGRRLEHSLPLRHKPLAVAGPFPVLRLPAIGANVQPLILLLLLEEQRVKQLLVRKRFRASLTSAGARLDIPLIHEPAPIIARLRPTATFYWAGESLGRIPLPEP